MNTFILLALFSGIAVASCLFTAAYFFFINRGRLIHTLLGILFIAIALRIGKSIFYYLIPEMSLFGIATGFLGLSVIGPTMFTYMRLTTEIRHKLKWIDSLHVLIPLIGFFSIWFKIGPITPSIGYRGATILLLVYLALSWRMIGLVQPDQKSWNTWLLGSMTMLWGALIYQIVSDTILDYALGAAFAALMIYALLFRMLKNPTVFQKKQFLNIDPALVRRVVQCLEGEKYYQQPALNLAQFASKLGEPVYLVSKAVKRHYGRNFPEVVNALRIEEVKRRLEKEKDEFIKVEGMAYDVGFNTPSAFYAAFKKETSSSPREYQKSLLG